VIIAIQTDNSHAIVDSPYLNVINELCETPITYKEDYLLPIQC